jgi:beta-lactamase superfamily II metal-dependent hydrolase
MSRSARARRGSKAAPAREAAVPRAGGTPSSDGRLIPPKGGAIVRMYRIGHGDCFLIAFDGDAKPVYVLIDCGYKPGSPGKIEPPTAPADVVANIKTATGGEIDVLVITHEHQDHVNAITERNFDGLKIAEAWFAWTEDPSDALANRLRARFDDQLQALLGMRNQIALEANGDAAQEARRQRIEAMLSFEIGGEVDPTFGAAGMMGVDFAAGGWTNKDSMSLVKRRASAARGITYLRPHEPVRTLTGTTDVRVLALGPPRKEALLDSLDPEGREEFRLGTDAIGVASRSTDRPQPVPPFDPRYVQRIGDGVDQVHFDDVRYRNSFAWFYDGRLDTAPAAAENDVPGFASPDDECVPRSDDLEVASNADWRRIDRDWSQSAEQLALDMNKFTNNSSLVLAFEIGRGGKVLLFAADAQRGNWISWADGEWQDGDGKVAARDLLARTVLLKVGHHGSHNATLNGSRQDTHPNLAWMATGSDAAREFTAIITAVRAWAETQNGWDHPMAAIKDALLAKADGRVLQTDTPIEAMRALHASGANAEWPAFLDRTTGTPLYFDTRIVRRDKPGEPAPPSSRAARSNPER